MGSFAPAATDGTAATPGRRNRAEVDLAEAARLPIDTPELKGRISLIGGRIDDLSLRRLFPRPWRRPARSSASCRRSVARSPTSALRLGRPGAISAFATCPLQHRGHAGRRDPDARHPGHVVWDQWRGPDSFRQHLAIDENFMFTVTQRSRTPASLGRLAPLRHRGPPRPARRSQNFFICTKAGPQGRRQLTTWLDSLARPSTWMQREGVPAEVVRSRRTAGIGIYGQVLVPALPGADQPCTRSRIPFEARRHLPDRGVFSSFS